MRSVEKRNWFEREEGGRREGGGEKEKGKGREGEGWKKWEREE